MHGETVKFIYSCVLTAILYEFVYLVLRYTTGMALLKIAGVP